MGGDGVVASILLLGQFPPVILKFLCTFLLAHRLDWPLELGAPRIKQFHVFNAKSTDFPHPPVEDDVSSPPVFAAVPPDGLFLAVSGDLDALFHTAVVDAHAFLLFGFFPIGFVEASAVDVGLPEQLAEARVGEIDTLFCFELRPFIRIVSIYQRFSAFHAELDSFEGKLMAVGAHLLIVEVLVVILVVQLFSDGSISFKYRLWPFFHLPVSLEEEGRPFYR